MLTKGVKGVGQLLIIAYKGGRGDQGPPYLVDIIWEQAQLVKSKDISPFFKKATLFFFFLYVNTLFIIK